MGMNDLGLIAHKCWQGISDHFPFVVLDEWVVMPNHVHGVLFIDIDMDNVGTQNPVGTQYFASLRQTADPETKPIGNRFGPPIQKPGLHHSWV